MPGMTGYDVAGAIREQWPQMPIILYTGLPFDISPDRQQLFTGIVGKTNCVELLNLIAITTQRIRKKPCI